MYWIYDPLETLCQIPDLRLGTTGLCILFTRILIFISFAGNKHSGLVDMYQRILEGNTIVSRNKKPCLHTIVTANHKTSLWPPYSVIWPFYYYVQIVMFDS